MNRPAYPVRIRLIGENDETLYEGEAVYRLDKPHPQSGEPVPQIGIPDAAMAVRPRGDAGYRLGFTAEELSVTGLYLDRVATCWWFILPRSPTGPPF